MAEMTNRPAGTGRLGGAELTHPSMLDPVTGEFREITVDGQDPVRADQLGPWKGPLRQNRREVWAHLARDLVIGRVERVPNVSKVVSRLFARFDELENDIFAKWLNGELAEHEQDEYLAQEVDDIFERYLAEHEESLLTPWQRQKVKDLRSNGDIVHHPHRIYTVEDIPSGFEILGKRAIGGCSFLRNGRPTVIAGESLSIDGRKLPMLLDERTLHNALANTKPNVEATQDAITAMRAELLSSADLDNIPELEPVIDGWLYKDSLARIVGFSGTYKSFIALDMAMHVATNRDWRNSVVSGGPVVYMVAEGVRGIPPRIRAWELIHNDGQPVHGMHFLPRPVQIGGSEWPVFTALCKELGAAMVIVDTQSRATVGVDENSAKDMGMVVDACESLRKETGACVLIIHHTGYDKSHARGSTAVYGALQTELSVERRGKDTCITLTAAKQKDGPEPAIELTMKPVGDSLIVSEFDPLAFETTESTDSIVVAVVKEEPGLSTRGLEDRLAQKGVKRDAGREAVERAVNMGLIHTRSGARKSKCYHPGPDTR